MLLRPVFLQIYLSAESPTTHSMLPEIQIDTFAGQRNWLLETGEQAAEEETEVCLFLKTVSDLFENQSAASWRSWSRRSARQEKTISRYSFKVGFV